MTRLSPAVSRTVAVLDFFADHPGEAFTLTELIRALRMSRATCHALLAALVDARYLHRGADKSYVLGPALMRLAAAAQLGERPMQAAAPEMRRLADSLDVICSAVFREGDEAVVRERASSLSHLGWTAQLGRRWPLRPPFGNIFMAWSESEEIARWLERVEPDAGSDTRARAAASLAFARRRGFTFGLRTEHLQDERHARSLTNREDKTDYLGGELRGGESYDLAFVAAPVFGAAGDVAFVLALMGFTASLDGAAVTDIGEQLRAACGRVSDFIGGVVPPSAAVGEE